MAGLRGFAAAAGLALTLAACGTISDDTAARLIVSPSRFATYPCPNIEQTMATTRKRNIELEQLMARASESAGGEFVSAIAYRTEYIQTKGDLEALQRVAAEKKCATESKYTSSRTLY